MEHSELTIVSVYGHNNGASAVPSIKRSMAELPGSKGLLLSLAKPDNYRYAPDHIAKLFSMEYMGPGFHDLNFPFEKLLGCHAQSRKLMDDDHIIVPADPTKAYGEVEFLTFLQSSGYTVEYRYETPVQV